MIRVHPRRFTPIRAAVSAATVLAMVFSVVTPALSAVNATFTGTVIAPNNSLASGFVVGFKDAASGQVFRSGPTTEAGEYQVAVPGGNRYKLDSVVAPDGTSLPVQDLPAVAVQVAGKSRVDVKFATLAPGATTPAADDDEKKKKKAAAPWWHHAGPIIGIVLGSLAVAAAGAEVFSSSDNTPAASPSIPPPTNK